MIPPLHLQVDKLCRSSLCCFVHIEAVFVLLVPDLDYLLKGESLSDEPLSFCKNSLIDHGDLAKLRLAFLEWLREPWVLHGGRNRHVYRLELRKLDEMLLLLLQETEVRRLTLLLRGYFYHFSIIIIWAFHKNSKNFIKRKQSCIKLSRKFRRDSISTRTA